MKIKIEIKNMWTGKVLFEFETEGNTIRKTLTEAVSQGADLTGADLTGADLTGAYLKGAYLTGADLTGADLKGADLTGAYLTGAYLTGADLTGAYLKGAYLTGAYLKGAYLTGADLKGAYLTGADLTPIKNDFFVVLLHSQPEIQFLRQNIIDGKIDGSAYDGECACLSGTLMNGVRIHNGEKQELIGKQIMSCRDASRPIERFFLGIKIGDTPENSQFSKIALEWLDEFVSLLPRDIEKNYL